MTLHRSTLSLGLALAILATGGVVEAQESGRPKHDPLQGMEPSGRILKVPCRPICAIRSAGGTCPRGASCRATLQRFLVSTFVAPQFFYDARSNRPDGFDWVWLLGVWQTGPAGRDVSRQHPAPSCAADVRPPGR